MGLEWVVQRLIYGASTEQYKGYYMVLDFSSTKVDIWC